MRILAWATLFAASGICGATAWADTSAPEALDLCDTPDAVFALESADLREAASSSDFALFGTADPVLLAAPGELLAGSLLNGASAEPILRLDEPSLAGELLSPLKFTESLELWVAAERLGPAAPTSEELRGPIPEAGSILTGLALITASFCSLRALSRRN